MKLLSFFVWTTVTNFLMISLHLSCPTPKCGLHFSKQENSSKGQVRCYRALQDWLSMRYGSYLPLQCPLESRFLVNTQHSWNTQQCLWPTVGNNLYYGPAYILSMLCLCVVLCVGMYKTENTFWLRSQVIYSDNFYPIPFHFLQCWLQPTKLVSYS